MHQKPASHSWFVCLCVAVYGVINCDENNILLQQYPNVSLKKSKALYIDADKPHQQPLKPVIVSTVRRDMQRRAIGVLNNVTAILLVLVLLLLKRIHDELRRNLQWLKKTHGELITGSAAEQSDARMAECSRH